MRYPDHFPAFIAEIEGRIRPQYGEPYPEFIRRLQERLKAGAEAYGDGSFERPLEEIADEMQQELEDVTGWAYCHYAQADGATRKGLVGVAASAYYLWLRVKALTVKLGVVLLALSMWGCVMVVPDWNTRPKGLHQEHEPELRAWTVPRLTGEAGDVVIFARANHAPQWRGAALEIRFNDRKLTLPSEPDLSWSRTIGLSAGRYEFRLRLLLDGESKVERKVTLTLREGDNEIEPWRGA